MRYCRNSWREGRKKKMRGKNRCCLMVLMILMGLVFWVAEVNAKTIELNFGMDIPTTHLRWKHIYEPWIKMVEEKSQGNLKIVPYFAGALASTTEAYDSTVSGVMDISEVVTGWTPGRFPLSETIMLPGIGLKTAAQSCKAYWHLYKTFPEVKKEYPGVKILWLHSNPAQVMITRDKPVQNLEDLKGMKIRVAGQTQVLMGKALGFQGVDMRPPDWYMSMEKGVIDGLILPWQILISRKLQEVSKYVIDVELGHDLFVVSMNQAKWNSLPPDVQKVFDGLTGDWAVDFSAKAWDKFDEDAKVELLAKGLKMITLTPAEHTKWNNALSKVKDDYAAQLESKGLPGKKVLAEVLKVGSTK
jgi:TRAP-type C4-dicarboxylate transport system substrate-binding protein